jgi:hypothetical protein
LFSGRPNPRWTLNAQTSGKLFELQARLTVARAVPGKPPGLGYRGFLYTNGTEEWLAYKGYVRSTRIILDDAEFTVEQFLLRTVPSEYDALREKVKGQLNRER